MAPEGQYVETVTFVKAHLAQGAPDQIAIGGQGRFDHHHLFADLLWRRIVPLWNQLQPLGLHHLKNPFRIPFQKQHISLPKLAIAMGLGNFLPITDDGPNLQVEIPCQATAGNGLADDGRFGEDFNFGDVFLDLIFFGQRTGLAHRQ